MSLSYWVCAIITAVSAAVSFGFSVAALRGGSKETLIASRYAAARSLALFAVALFALFTASVPFVTAVAIAMVIVQAADAVVGVSIRDRMKTIGPAVITVVNLAALIWMLAS